MFQRVLIANRGEIAVRIIRACHDLGIRAVAVYSTADADSLHVQMADEAICVGPPAATDSYLKIANIISAAEVADVDAIHPGYGFLAENAHFAEVCENCKIAFIGPRADSIRRMGDKAVARETMRAAGVPITPGSDGILKNPDEALACAEQIGYPVLLKAVAGGGGKGMRIAHNDVSLVQAFMTASAEADRAFGNSALYLEKLVENARHIEVQVLGDGVGGAVHLGERDCSIQRRHQKLIEECPSPAIDEATRARLGAAACQAAAAVQYTGAGTVEFLYDDATGHFYFMEMNTRIQVEHPVTEEVTGIDLIAAQLQIAAGEPFIWRQEEIRFQGHAIELRINAEDPFAQFRPCPGTIQWVHFPGGPGVRVDSHVYTGYRIPSNYDSMIAKLIVHAPDRPAAIQRMARALSEFALDGPATTAPLGSALMKDTGFRSGRYNTQYLERLMADGMLLSRARELRGE
ncbi:MAG: acetyl-CoA carboxylase biotin carboxylase subunit [Candidatus Marinimicrobia bacterium]|nr:acetyl-CoA carboxylase biotin carboxylase subunit [Candidatus Neomarinimicrobiota bacterium]